MIYRKFKDKEISALAFGAMRLPVIGGNDGSVDIPKAEALVDMAYKAGINYFDTAWGYHMGNSETLMGLFLKKYPRESFNLATKFPGYDVSNFGKAAEIFEKQLHKCQVDYFDFYLMHNVCELNIDKYLDDETYGTVSYFVEQVRNGRIRHLGFSAHGSTETVARFLEKYGQYMEFGMIQLNYVDYSFQNAQSKLALLKEYGIPVMVMEPLRGGMLAKMSDEDLSRMKEFRLDADPVKVAFRFLQSIPEVVTVLTGMSDKDQMREKLVTYAVDDPMDDAEKEAVIDIGRRMISKDIQPCTACRYCLSSCPKGLDIPKFIELYNEHVFSNGGFIAPLGIVAKPKAKRPSACIQCGACENVCPQQLKIVDILADLHNRTEKMVTAFDKS
ncbi:MAG: aldo/keto reductase [archaeon]|nr:aldo/keto reductase [archaeon]